MGVNRACQHVNCTTAGNTETSLSLAAQWQTAQTTKSFLRMPRRWWSWPSTWLSPPTPSSSAPSTCSRRYLVHHAGVIIVYKYNIYNPCLLSIDSSLISYIVSSNQSSVCNRELVMTSLSHNFQKIMMYTQLDGPQPPLIKKKPI